MLGIGDAASIGAVAYTSVLAAELLGDRSLYSITALASRFNPRGVLVGVSAAFAAKTTIAVLLAGLVAGLPRTAIAVVSAAGFLVTAVMLWRDDERAEPARVAAAPTPIARVVPTAFMSIFCMEWGDPGQLATATLAARSQAPGVVWAGATLALVTKGILALTLGLGLRRYVPRTSLRRGAIALCVLLSGLSLVVQG